MKKNQTLAILEERVQTTRTNDAKRLLFSSGSSNGGLAGVSFVSIATDREEEEKEGEFAAEEEKAEEKSENSYASPAPNLSFLFRRRDEELKVNLPVRL